jgi:hypothetical protein
MEALTITGVLHLDIILHGPLSVCISTEVYAHKTIVLRTVLCGCEVRSHPKGRKPVATGS